VLRKALQGLFRVINFTNSALSRQMEYNADLVAVSVTGSDALIHGLARLDFATETLGQAWNDLTVAADHQLFSRDLFYHQTRAAEYLRAMRRDPQLGEPPVLPEDPRQTVQVFRPEDTSVPKMWATHPTNYDREMNAKSRYVRSPIDERSPWLLFQDGPAVREEVTRRLYEVAPKLTQVPMQAPEVVQAFLDEEHAETTYHPRYHGLYDQRYLTPGNLDELLRTCRPEFSDAGRLAQAQARLYGDDLQERMKAHQGRQKEYHLVAPLAQGAVELTGNDFQFRGARFRAADARSLLDQLKKELDEDFAWMSTVDHEVILVHHEMAGQLGETVRREFEERYRFHLAVQEIHGQLSADRGLVQGTLGQIAGKRQLSEGEFYGVLADLRLAYNSLAEKLEAARSVPLPVLKNVTPGEPLSSFLMNRPLIGRFRENQNRLDGEWIGRFLEQLSEVLDRAQRIHFKSLGGILALQEEIVRRWADRPVVPEAGHVASQTERI